MRSCKRLLSVLGGGLLLVASFSASAAWQVVGEVTRSTPTADGLNLATISGASVQLSFVSANAVRIRMSPNGVFAPDFSYAVEGKARQAVKLKVDDNAERIEIRADSANSARLVVQKKPALLITVYDAQGRVVVADDPARPMVFDPATGAVETSKQRGATELYYGFGEQALPLSRDQQYVAMWNTDAGNYPAGTSPLYQTIPFFTAVSQGRAYGVFFDNTWRSYFDMGMSDPTRYTFGANGGELNYYVLTGGSERTPSDVLAEYTELTGRGSLPPIWALGYQQSRYSYTPQAKVEAIARTFREKKIPGDVIYLDIDYMDGFRIFTWNPQTFAEPKKMLAELKSEGFHTVTIVDPGVKYDEQYSVYQSGKAQGIYVRDAAGKELHARVWPGICAFPDFTDPKARAWWGAQYGKSLDEGVDGFWNDMNEPATFRLDDSTDPQPMHDPSKTFALDVQHNGDGQPGNHARYHNVFGMQMARGTFEGVQKLRPDNRPFVLTRAGYAGVQRYAAVWSGDNIASWEHLALTIPLLTNLSISGVPFIGADVGGFNGTPSSELYTRWLQAAALTPFFRTHSAIDTAPREPWTYGGESEQINRATIELRYRILPYIYTLFAQNERDGRAVLRPLWFEYPSDPKAALLDDQYLVGKDLLVAPVLHASAVKRNVYFPRGDAWLDWWDGTRHEGGTNAEIAAPLDRLPLFIRAGASIPTQPVIQNTAEMKTVPLTIAVALGADGKGSIYQDSGEGYAYRKGASRTTQVELHGKVLSIQSSKSKDFQRIGAVEFVGLDAAPKSVSIDGKMARTVAYDDRTKRLRVDLPDDGVRQIALNP
jgi:alpha-glucosidase